MTKRTQPLGRVIRNDEKAIPGRLRKIGREWQLLGAYFALGAILAVLVFHPAMEALHLWRVGVGGRVGLLDTIVSSFTTASTLNMLPMTLGLGLGGGFCGILFAFLHLWLRPVVESEAGEGSDPTVTNVRSLILAGESERVEFKSSLRWDRHNDRLNKKLELAILKSIAGFLNHEGGDLLIGVTDSGEISGIERDCQSLSHPNWDGFERTLVNLVSSRLGPSACMSIHNQRIEIGELSICRVSVNKADTPVYCRDGNIERYYVRIGNTTRELDAHEAVDHIAARSRATSIH